MTIQMSNPQKNAPTTLTVSKRYNASQQDVFDAWVTLESLKQWMCPKGGHVAFAALDLRVGGAYRIDMQFGTEVTVHRGIYREIQPPDKLVFTWVSVNTQNQESLVTIELFAHGEQTELILTHTRLPNQEAVGEHLDGWTSVLVVLEEYLQ